eukprot:1351787-Amorphochlora_amoeboformis.AAC.1
MGVLSYAILQYARSKTNRKLTLSLTLSLAVPVTLSIIAKPNLTATLRFYYRSAHSASPLGQLSRLAFATRKWHACVRLARMCQAQMSCTYEISEETKIVNNCGYTSQSISYVTSGEIKDIPLKVCFELGVLSQWVNTKYESKDS